MYKILLTNHIQFHFCLFAEIVELLEIRKLWNQKDMDSYHLWKKR